MWNRYYNSGVAEVLEKSDFAYRLVQSQCSVVAMITVVTCCHCCYHHHSLWVKRIFRGQVDHAMEVDTVSVHWSHGALAFAASFLAHEVHLLKTCSPLTTGSLPEEWLVVPSSTSPLHCWPLAGCLLSGVSKTAWNLFKSFQECSTPKV